jgi:four helix bundle protein
MAVRRLENLLAFQLAGEFKGYVYDAVDQSAAARQDLRFRDQICDAASGVESCIAERFSRRSPGEFAQFLRYALASLSEAETRLTDGIDRRYFTTDSCARAFTYACRCRSVTAGLLASQVREARARREKPQSSNRREPAPSNRRRHPKKGQRE